MGRVKIHGSEYPIKKVFSNEFAFSIPRYQRPYAWTTEHAAELLSDLLGALSEDHRSSIDELDPYFHGSIVLIKEEDRPEAEVVDGQQRLMTLAILLSVLRATVGPEEAEGLREFIYEKGNPIAGTNDRYRLTPRQRDEDFVRKYVQQEHGLVELLKLDPARLNDSQRNFRNNAEHFDWELRKLSPESRVKLAKFLIQRTYLVAVSTPNLDSAYRIFSILNERGLDLSHADILKSEIIGQIPGDRQDEYATKWEKAEEDLGRDEFVDIFAHIRMIYGKVKLRETVLKEFRSSVISRFPDQMELIDKVILPFADAYREVKTRSYESARGAEPINELLGWLNRIDNFDWIPPAIVGMSKWGKHPDRLRRFLMDLERLAASMMIRRADVNHRIERYGRVLVSIEEGEDLSSSASPLQLSSDECRETLKVLGGDIYPIVKIRLYVLLRLDAALSGGGATYDYPLITVEHVLPQNPETGSEWERWFPEAESREMYTHRLGNLVLLTRMKNSQASNYPFERKKNEYFSRKGVSPFALTTQVLTKKVWTPEVIDRRQQELLGNLKGLWRL